MKQAAWSLFSELSKIVKGGVAQDNATLLKFSHDASLFEIKPQVVAYPKDSSDVCTLVKYVSENKPKHPDLSLTARSGGTDMTGGSINESIIVAFEKHMSAIGAVNGQTITTQPGVYYRDFEPITLTAGMLMPSYPASREICMIGGMVANDAGGEKSLIYGKTHRYVESLKVVLHDGQEHTIKPLRGPQLAAKLSEQGAEGEIYRQIHQLAVNNQAVIEASKPKVSKNSTGYNLWEVWDGETLDLTKLIVGSQGTLGLVTEVTFRLVPAKPLSGMVVAFLPDLANLAKVINESLRFQPTSLESFDEHTIKFAFRFFLSFRKTLGWVRFVLLGLSFIPVLGKLLSYFPKLPKIIVMIVFEGDSQADIDRRMSETRARLEELDIETHIAPDKQHEEKFWIMRRESFNLLRKNVKRKHTAPFIDDLVVPPDSLPKFLPKLITILEKHQLLYTIAGHVGDGNFHIIPLMRLEDPKEREKIPVVLKEVMSLVLEYDGSLSGEHNDGLIRGPFLDQMYPPEMMALFRQVKDVFDPKGIFNPHKKVTANWEYSKSRIRSTFA